MASESDEEINAEFEREAEQAFQNVVKGARKREDDNDEFELDDEFDEAFNAVEYDVRTAGNERDGPGLAKQQQIFAANDGSETSWPKNSEMQSNVDSGQGTDHEIFDEKENTMENMKRLIDLVSCCFMKIHHKQCP